MDPKISVVMSVYNAEEHIEASIQSILGQSFKGFEFLIVNDGSTDSTFSKLQKFAKIDSRITLLNQENIGLTKSLVKAIKLSKGRYIARMDADDVSTNNRFVFQLRYLEKYPAVGMIGSCVQIIDSLGRKQSNKKLPQSNNIIKRRLKYGNQFVHGSVMFARDVYFAVGGYDEYFRYSQDYDLWLRISKISQCANHPDYLYLLRVHDCSISNKNSDSQLDFAVDAIIKNVPHDQLENDNLSFGIRRDWKVFGGKDQGVDIDRVKRIVSARLLLRRGDYKRAMLFYSKLNTIEAMFMLLILRSSRITFVAKKVYSGMARILK